MLTQEDLEAEFHNIFAYCNLVLAHYNCPKECEGFCCKSNSISFGVSEYHTIYRRYPKARKFLRNKVVTETDDVSGYTIKSHYFSEKPCPLLSPTNRCTVQEAKPIVCQLYPIGTNPTGKEHVLSINPCPLGLRLIADYILYRSLAVLQNDDLSENRKSEIIGHDVKMVNEIIEDAKDFRKKEVGMNMSVPLESFKFLNTFLEMTTPEDRLHDILELGIHLPKTT